MTKPIKYKETGLEWCPQIPEHWEVRKISQGFNIIGSGTTPSAGNVLYYENGVYNWLQTGDLTNNEINTTSRKITKEALDDYSTLRFYQKGSLVIAMYGATIGKVGILNIETTTNQACCVLSNSTIWIIRYIYYWFIANRNHIITLSYGGGQPNISQQTIRDLRVTLPPLTEQQKIADYLDQKTSLIDSIISKKEKQIELYKEERTAVINQAVTKGLNPDVEMKDSGIEWLGSIPKHWEVKKLKYVINLLTDFTANGSFADLAKNVTYLDYPDYARLIRLTDLRVNLINTGIYISEDSYNFLEKSKLFGGEILMANVGAYAGHSFLFINKLNIKASLAPNMFLLKFNQKLNESLIFYLLNSGSILNQLILKASSTAQPKLNKDNVKDTTIPLPPLSEQQEIVTYLDNETNRIDTLVSKTSKQIQLLKEYKEALINEVVTGQRIID